MMFVESVADMMKACDGRDACGTVKNHEQTEKVKKVDIA